MPFPIVTVPRYPDVPRASGVPPVLRNIAAVANPIIILAADAVQLLGIFSAQWGIFDQGGQPVAIADSVLGVDFRKEFRISNYPQEPGAFQSYNKVETPYDAKVTLACGDAGSLFSFPGSQVARRTAFLSAIDAAVASLDLYAVITPEFTYESANLIHYDYRRSARGGASLLEVDIWLEEVRVTATADFTNTASPAGANPANGGAVQPTAPTPSQASNIPNNLT